MNEEISKDQDEVLAGIEAATEAAEVYDGPCPPYSREGDGWESDDPIEWKVGSLHEDGGFVGLVIEDQGVPNENIVITSMSVYTATKLARDILAVAAHVEDVAEEEETVPYQEAEQRATAGGYFSRLVPRTDEEQPTGDDRGFNLDGTPITYPMKRVPCGSDDEGAQPDVQAMLRAEFEARDA